MAKSMLKQKKLPHSFWGEVVSTIIHVLNKFLTKKPNSKVPEEVWCETKIVVNHLKIFGFVCYKHVPDAKKSKVQDKSEAMIFVCYHSTRAYQLYNPTTTKICISKYVVVNEAEMWDWSDIRENSMQIGRMSFKDEEEKLSNETSFPDIVMQDTQPQTLRTTRQ